MQGKNSSDEQLFFLVQSKTIQGPGFPGEFYLFAFKVSLEIQGRDIGPNSAARW